MPKRSTIAAKNITDSMRASIAALSTDMRNASLSSEDRCAIRTRCKALFVQWAALQDSDAAMDEEVGAFDIMAEMIDLFENYVNSMTLSSAPSC